MNAPLKIVFAGTPEFAALHLQALIDSHHEVIAVYSQPDRPAGRGNKLQASAVKQLALQHNIPVYQPVSLKSADAQAELANLQADLMVVVAYGLLLPQPVLDTPKYGCINVHGSLLPSWRGAAPIQRAIWAGDAQTGVTIMQMDAGLDTGPMLHTSSIAIDSTDTSATLYQKLAEIGPQALLDTLDKLADIKPQKQDDSQASYAKKLSKEEARINWQDDAEQLERNVRAFNPWPVSYFELGGQTVKVWQSQLQLVGDNQSYQPGEIIRADKQGILVKAGKHALLLQNLQFPGKKPMAIADVLNGRSELFAAGNIIE